MKKKKKGSIFLEFIAVLPTFYLVAWGTMQAIFFTMSQSTIHQAAMDGARITAVELRGWDKPITDYDKTKQSAIEQKLKQRIQNATSFNSLILLFKDKDGNPLDLKDVKYIVEDPTSCDNAMDGKSSDKRVICVYTDDQQIVVKVKAEFHVIGSWIPGTDGKFFTRGFGASEIEKADRYQYVNE